jgi:hypothetical protein
VPTSKVKRPLGWPEPVQGLLGLGAMRLYGWPVFELLNFLSLIEHTSSSLPDLRMKHDCPRVSYDLEPRPAVMLPAMR